MVHPARYTGIDLFAGAGGLSLGLENAGFDIKLGIEIDPYCCATLSRNHKRMTVITSDIHLVRTEDALEKASLDKGELAIVAGGPPCQGFSQSNRRTRTVNNPLNHLYLEFFRFVEELDPPAFFLENVGGLRTLDNGSILHDIVSHGKKLGYFVSWNVINAEDLSVPQREEE